MDRTLKFRAWDKEYENMYATAYPFEHLVYVEMFDDDETFQQFKHKMQVVNGKYFYFIIAKDMELMQSTGLTDRNDKEIYEGDIVTYQLFESGQTYTGVVEYNSGAFMIDPATHLSTGLYRCVIGNVFENSDLLKKEQ